MKKNWIFIFLLIFLIFIKYSISQTPELICSIETTCSYTGVFRISDLTDAHAELMTQSNYPYIVCCRVNGLTLSVFQEIGGGFIGLSNPTDAHVEAGNQNNYGYHLKFNPSYGNIICNIDDSCDSYDTCLVSISDLTDAHVSDCVTNPYQKKICCSFSSLDITLNLNSSRVQWYEGLKAWGQVKKNGSPLENADVYVKINDKIYCQLKTNSFGYYECSFTIEKSKIEILNVSATVIDPLTLESETAKHILKIYINFGHENKAKNILCDEKQRLIQNPDGSIDIAKINICVWK